MCLNNSESHKKQKAQLREFHSVDRDIVNWKSYYNVAELVSCFGIFGSSLAICTGWGWKERVRIGRWKGRQTLTDSPYNVTDNFKGENNRSMRR